jgi:hypothetical protein
VGLLKFWRIKSERLNSVKCTYPPYNEGCSRLIMRRKTRFLATFIVALMMISTLSIVASTPIIPFMQVIKPVNALPTPTLTPSKNSGFAADGVSADYVTVTGIGFAAGRDVAFYWVGVGKYPASGGLFPAGPTFAADVFAQGGGATNKLPDSVFFLTAPNDRITFKSQTFAHGGDVRTDSYGFFKATLQIPSLPAGTWKLDVLLALDGATAPAVTGTWAGTAGVSFTINASIEEKGTGGSVHPRSEGYVGDSLEYKFGGFGKYTPGTGIASESVDVTFTLGSTNFCYAGPGGACIITAVGTTNSIPTTTGLKVIKSMFGGTYTVTAKGETSLTTATSSINGATTFKIDPKVWFWDVAAKTNSILSKDLATSIDVFVSAEGLPSGTVTAATLAGQTLVPQSPFPISVTSAGAGPTDFGQQGSIGGGVKLGGGPSYNAIDFKSTTGNPTLGIASLVLTVGGTITFAIPDRCWTGGVSCTGTTNQQDQGGIVNSHIPFQVSADSDGTATFTTEAAKSGSYSAKLSGGTAGGATGSAVKMPFDVPLSLVTDVNFWYNISSASAVVPVATQNAWPLYVRSTRTFPLTADGYYSPYVVLKICKLCDDSDNHFIISQIWQEPAANLNTWIQWKMTDHAVAYGGGAPTQALWHDTFINDPCAGPGGSWPAYWCPLSAWQTFYAGYKIVRVGIDAGYWAFTQNQIVYADLLSMNGGQYDIEGGFPSTSLQVLTQAVGSASFGCVSTNPVNTVGSCDYEFVAAGLNVTENTFAMPIFLDTRTGTTRNLMSGGTGKVDANGAFVGLTTIGLPKVTGFPTGGSYKFDLNDTGGGPGRVAADTPTALATSIVPSITFLDSGSASVSSVFWRMSSGTPPYIINGTGFAKGQAVTVTIGGFSLPCGGAPLTGSIAYTDEGVWNTGVGSSIGCSVTGGSMPDLPGGAQLLAASTASSGTKTLPVTVMPFIDSTYPLPNTGTVGAAVAMEGHGFPPGSATIYWGPFEVGASSGASVPVNSLGMFSAGVIVPSTPGDDDAGNGGVTLIDVVGSGSLLYGKIAFPQFTVSPSMPVSLGTAHVGDSVGVAATGLAVNTQYHILYDGLITGVSFTSTANGASGSTSFPLPSPTFVPVFPPTSAGNKREVEVWSGTAGGSLVVESRVNVLPSYTLSKISGAAGETVTVTGAAFGQPSGGSTTLKILFGGNLAANPATVGLLVATFTPSYYGLIPPTPFTVPSYADGTYNVQIWNDANNNGVQEYGELATLPADVQTFKIGLTFSVTFSQTGIASGVTWGVTVGSTHYSSTAPSSIPVSGLTGTTSYTYDSPVSGTGGAYTCASNCFGLVSSSTGTVSATYTFSSLSGVGLAISQVFQSSATLGFERTANIYDSSAVGYMYGHRSLTKIMFLATDTTYVYATGGPKWSGYTNLITVGGRLANPTVKYYEDLGAASLTGSINATHYTIKKGSTVELSVPISSVGSTNDYFVMEVLQDGGHTVILFWGLQQYGTYASGVYFDNKYADPSALSDGWYIIHWVGNGYALPTDTFTIHAQGN